MNKISDAFIAKIESLSDEEAAKISRLIELIYFVEQGRKSERKFYIPLSFFPKDLSKFEIITLLDKLEKDFNVIVFHGFINGEQEEVADIYYPEYSMLFNFQDLIKARIGKIANVAQGGVVNATEDSSGKIIFDAEKSILYLNGKKIKIAVQRKDKRTDAHFLLSIIFSTDDLQKDWDFEDVAEIWEQKFAKAEEKMINDSKIKQAAYSINRKVELKDFIDVKSQTVCINKKYL